MKEFLRGYTLYLILLIGIFTVSATGGTAYAGGGEIKIDPKLLKKLLNKQTFKVNPGLSIEPLFTFNVPVNIQKVHKDVEKAYVACVVTSDSLFFGSHRGAGLTEIPLNNGAYNGNVMVRITSMEEGDPAGVSTWYCLLAFKIKGVEEISLFSNLDVKYGPAPNTPLTPMVGGTLFP